MEEYKFNSESSYSQGGERNSSIPITVAFRDRDINEPPKKKKNKGVKVLLSVALVIIIAGVSFVGGTLGAMLYSNQKLPQAVAEYCDANIQTGNSAALLDIYNSQNAPTASNTATSVSPSVTSPNSTYASVAAAVKPSIVEITTEIASSNSFFQQFIQSGAGSGVIISEGGYIVTNHHVIDGATKITVRMHDGKEFAAKVMGTDDQADIAVLKIESDTALPYAKIGNSANLVVGEEVLAIGNPLGSLGGSVTNGIISALDRELTIDGQKMRLLQTNAAINPGNSGGGLFNLNGELVAIVNAKSAGTGIEGLGFAIPINYAFEIATELLENGYVSGRPILGITYIEINDYMDLMRYGVSSYGIYVYDGGSTDLKNGDRIVRIGEHEVQNSASLKSAIQSYKVGDTVTVTVVRGGAFVEISATLIENKPVDTDKVELRTE